MQKHTHMEGWGVGWGGVGGHDGSRGIKEHNDLYYHKSLSVIHISGAPTSTQNMHIAYPSGGTEQAGSFVLISSILKAIVI